MPGRKRNATRPGVALVGIRKGPASKTAQADYTHLPSELTRRARWVLWRLETDETGPKDAKPKKVPYQVEAQQARASSTDSTTWSSFERAVEVLPMSVCNGIGFVFDGDGLVGLDLDNVLEDGEIKGWARELVARLPETYTELSPSGTGLHAYFRAPDLPPGGRNKDDIEIYSAARFFTVTGDRFGTAPSAIEDGGDALRQLYDSLGGSSTSTTARREDWGDIELRPKADVTELLSWLMQEPNFSDTWHGHRADLGDDASRYDLAIARQAARRGITDGQVLVDLMLARRRQNGLDLHLLNTQKYVRTAAKALAVAHRSLKVAVLDAVTENKARLQAKSRRYREPAWTFARRLKGHPALRRAEAHEAVDILEPLLQQLLEDGQLPNPDASCLWTAALGEKDNRGHTIDPMESFISLWEKLKPKGTLELAADRAHELEEELAVETFGPELVHRAYKKLRVFLVLAHELDSLHKGEAFRIAVEPVAEALGADRTTVGRWRKRAEDLGILSKVEDHVPHVDAAKYRLTRRCFDARAAPGALPPCES